MVRTTAVKEFVRCTDAARSGGVVLVDSSVLVRCAELDVAARLLPLLVLGDLVTCAAVQHELAGRDDGAVGGALGALLRTDLAWLETEDNEPPLRVGGTGILDEAGPRAAALDPPGDCGGGCAALGHDPARRA
jgi:hypothetical protein